MDVILKESLEKIEETGAKQETSEAILEAVGNVAQADDVQEIFGKVDDLYKLQSQNKNMISFAAYYSEYTGAKTVLDVIGSGELYRAFAIVCSPINAGKNGWVKITVDGEVLTHVKFNNNNTSNEKQLHFMLYNVGFELFNGGFCYVDRLESGGITSLKSTSTSANSTAIGSGETTLDSVSDVIAFYPTPNPIRFNESLKIEIYNGFSKISKIDVLYSLDE